MDRRPDMGNRLDDLGMNIGFGGSLRYRAFSRARASRWQAVDRIPPAPAKPDGVFDEAATQSCQQPPEPHGR